tara:strand:- start:944 stop:1447 length:504 start_codon:yes stop_codon:yes gene_type:complete
MHHSVIVLEERRKNMRKQWEPNKPIFIRQIFDRVQDLDANQCLLFFTHTLSAHTAKYEEDLHSTQDPALRLSDKVFYITQYATLLEYASQCAVDKELDLQPLHDAIIQELLQDYHSDSLRQYQIQGILELIVLDTKYDITLWKKLLWDHDYLERFDELDDIAAELEL